MSVLCSHISLRPWLLATAMLLAPGWAQAQWQWIDDAGRKVFSDTPPPATVPDRNVLRRPNARAAPAALPAPESTPEATEATPASAATPGRDEQLEARKKQAEAAEKARQQAELERVARIRQENCERAKRARTTLMSGIRVSSTNARGEVVIMDDKARAAEMQRLDRIMAADCGPLPQASQ